MDCIFCKIIKKKEPADIVYEDKKVIVFKSKFPKADLHILIIPKRHIQSINYLKEKDKDLVGQLFMVAQKIAKEKKVAKKGYKLIFNVGKEGGQLINHLHLHLLYGKRIYFP